MLFGDKSSLRLSQNTSIAWAREQTGMYHSCLVHKVQASQDHKQELLQESFVERPVLEQISQVRQTHA